MSSVVCAFTGLTEKAPKGNAKRGTRTDSTDNYFEHFTFISWDPLSFFFWLILVLTVNLTFAMTTNALRMTAKIRQASALWHQILKFPILLLCFAPKDVKLSNSWSDYPQPALWWGLWGVGWVLLLVLPSDAIPRCGNWGSSNCACTAARCFTAWVSNKASYLRKTCKNRSPINVSLGFNSTSRVY